MIPYSTSFLTPQDKQAVLDVLDSNWLTRGDATKRLEARLAEVSGKKYCVVVSNGTMAQLAAVQAVVRLYPWAGVEGSVLTTPLTFNSIGNVAVYLGMGVTFRDVDGDTLCAELTNDNDDNVLPVWMDYAGYPFLDKPIITEYPIILDACHSFGADAFCKFADVAICSGHPTKTVTGAELGWVLTDRDDIDRQLRVIRDNGRENGLHITAGLNLHSSQLSTALCLSQLDRLEEILSRKRQIADRYYSAWGEDVRIVLPAYHPGHAWHLYPIRLPGYDTFKFQDWLKSNGIGAQKHYRLMNQMPMFDLDISCPVAERAYQQLLSIPMFYGLTDEQQGYVIQTINRGLEECQ